MAAKKAHTCAICAQDAMMRCSRCKVAWYCTKAHQQEDWLTTHKTTCVQKVSKNTQTIVRTPEIDLSATPPMTHKEKFLWQRYNQLRQSLSLNRSCQWVVEGRLLLFMLLSKKETNSVVAKLLRMYIAWIVAYGFSEQAECQVDARFWKTIFNSLNSKLFDDFPLPFVETPSVAREKNPMLYEEKATIYYVHEPRDVTSMIKHGLPYFAKIIQAKGHMMQLIYKGEKQGGFDIVAACDIKRGTVVFVEDMWLAGRMDNTAVSCDHCVSEIIGNTSHLCRKKCGMQYCSTNCEKRAWTTYHEFLCSRPRTLVYREMQEYVPKHAQSSSGRFPLLLLKMVGMALRCEHPADLWATEPFCYLQRPPMGKSGLLSGYSSFMRHVFSMIVSPMEDHDQKQDSIRTGFDLDWVLTASGFLCVNAFTLEPSLFHAGLSGICMGSVISLFNHSCENNITWEPVAGSMAIATVKDVKAGESLRLCYSSDASILQPFYDFECQCAKCV